MFLNIAYILLIKPFDQKYRKKPVILYSIAGITI